MTENEVMIAGDFPGCFLSYCAKYRHEQKIKATLKAELFSFRNGIWENSVLKKKPLETVKNCVFIMTE